MSPYAKILSRIGSSHLSREELSSLRANALKVIGRGNAAAQEVLDAINRAAPTDSYFVFMGFCPGADFSNRLDMEWKRKGICTFEFFDSERQMKRFRSIHVGDMIILKKNQERGRTMRLYGHGRVASLDKSPKGDFMLKMLWSTQADEIEVPLMACNDTVNIRELERVDKAMPDEFWRWINDVQV